MNSYSVYAIIINWNGKFDTSECLASLSNVHHDNPFLHVVVVDNHSTDGSLIEIKRKFPWVHCIAAEKNLGFSGGNNKGILYALEQHADIVWLLNNDTVVDTKVLSALNAFKDSSVGAVGSKIYFYKGCEFHKNRYTLKDLGHVLWYAGGIIDWKNMMASHRGVDEVDRGQFNKQIETGFITGCSYFIRTDILKKVGYLDESYFMYMEDLDLSFRIQHAGYKTVYNPASIVWHKNASSSGGSGSGTHEYYQTRNRLKIGMKYAPLRTKIALIREAVRFCLYGSKLKRKAVFDWALGNMGTFHEA